MWVPRPKIYELIVEMVKKGLSVIMISCEEAEILGMCHRVLVMRDGKNFRGIRP